MFRNIKGDTQLMKQIWRGSIGDTFARETMVTNYFIIKSLIKM